MTSSSMVVSSKGIRAYLFVFLYRKIYWLPQPIKLVGGNDLLVAEEGLYS